MYTGLETELEPHTSNVLKPGVIGSLQWWQQDFKLHFCFALFSILLACGSIVLRFSCLMNPFVGLFVVVQDLWVFSSELLNRNKKQNTRTQVCNPCDARACYNFCFFFYILMDIYTHKYLYICHYIHIYIYIYICAY